MKRLYIVGLLATIVVTALALGACAPAAPASPASAPVSSAIPDISIKAVDFSYDAPAQFQSGIVSVTMTNEGKEPHQAQFARLNDGVTMDQLQTALKGSPDAALALVSLSGGPNAILPGSTQKVTMNLAPGNYIMLCFVSGADNVPHLAKGMIKPIQIAAAPAGAAGAPNTTAKPTSDGAVTLKDFAIAVPENLKAGTQTWEVANAGPQPHELTIMKLDEGKTMADLAPYFNGTATGDPPMAPAGGLGAISANSTAWVTADLKPGNYIALCFVPDPASGKSHAELGMMTPFTVK